MVAYIMFQENVFDAEAFEDYKALTPATIEQFGGRFIVRGGDIETLSGTFTHERVVIIEFPTSDAARSWFDSNEYAPARAMRENISEGDVILVEGV